MLTKLVVRTARGRTVMERDSSSAKEAARLYVLHFDPRKDCVWRGNRPFIKYLYADLFSNECEMQKTELRPLSRKECRAAWAAMYPE